MALGAVGSETNLVVDGRYRIERVILASDAATVFEAIHRNGATAWLKVAARPDLNAFAEAEGLLTNAFASGLRVRDDGITGEGLAYLVLDPLHGELLHAALARGDVPLATALVAGDALCESLAGLHAQGFALPSVDCESIFLTGSATAAFLGLEKRIQATEPSKAANRAQVVDVLRRLIGGRLAMVIDPQASIESMRAVWRSSAPEAFEQAALSVRILAGQTGGGARGVSQPSSMFVPAVVQSPSQPPARSVLAGVRAEGAAARASEPPMSAATNIADSPLLRVHELPRFVQALGPRDESHSNRRVLRGRLGLAAGVVTGIVAIVALAFALVRLGGDSPLGERTTAPADHPTQTSAPIVGMAEPPGAELGVASDERTTVFELPSTEPTVVELDEPLPEARLPPALPTTPPARLRTVGAAAGISIFVDGRLVGLTPLDVRSTCGRHRIQAGKAAPRVAVDLPCGGMRTLRFSPSGRTWVPE